MNTTAGLDLRIWRNDDVYEFPLRVRGPNLTDVAMRGQIRLAPDTPGAPLVNLSTVTNGNEQGIRLAGVTQLDGVWENDVRIRLNKSTRQALPYAGEIGSSTTLSWAFQIAGRTRLVGEALVLAHAIDSDNAPLNRPTGFSARTTGLPSGGATLTIAEDDVAELTIDGADLLGPEIARATAAAERAEEIAAAVSIEEALGGWQDVVVDADNRVLSGYHPVLGAFDAGVLALSGVVDEHERRLDALDGGSPSEGQTIPRVGGWITATVDADGRVVEGEHELLGTFPSDGEDTGSAAWAARMAELRGLRLGDVAAVHPAPPRVVRRTLSSPLIASPQIVNHMDQRLTPSLPLVRTGAGYPYTEFARGGWITIPNEAPTAPHFSIRFLTDSPMIEARYGYSGQAHIRVDGHPLSIARTLDLVDGEDDWPVIGIDFGADTETIRPRWSVSAGGAGYAEGDQVTVAGTAGDPIVMAVTSINADGSIRASGLRVVSWGTLTALQPGAVAVQGGSGAGATVTLTDDAGGVSQSGHTTRRMRRVELVLGSGLVQICDIRVTPGSTVRPWPFAGPRLMAMQDSYGQVFTDRPGGQWAERMAERLGIEDVWLNTIGGTGFTAGDITYAERLPDIAAHLPGGEQPLIFLTQGSINDAGASAADLRAAVEAYWNAAFAALPADAVMIQTGILRAAGNNPPDALSAAVRDGFAAVCAARDPLGKRSGFIETRAPLAMMTVPDQAAEWISGDDAHLTQSGHDFIGDALAPELLRILQSLSI